MDRSRRDIIYWGVVFNPTGYATETRRFVRMLADHGYHLRLLTCLEPDDQYRVLQPDERRQLLRLRETPVSVEDATEVQHLPPCQFDLRYRPRLRVARTTCESIGLPRGWSERMQSMERVWVPSPFNIETFAEAGVAHSKLRLVPEGVDTDRFHPGCPPLPIPGRRGFNFLSLFDWNRRKGWDLLLQAYLTEFKPDEDVALILKTSVYSAPRNRVQEQMHQFIATELGLNPAQIPSLILMEGFLHEDDIPRLYAAADAFVLPSRGEGWGLPFCEAMACGLPTIATRWGGHLTFMNDDNSYLLDITGTEPMVQNDHPYYSPSQRWSRPSVEHLRQLLRHLYSHREEASARGWQARADMAAHWGWQHAFGYLRAAMDEVLG